MIRKRRDAFDRVEGGLEKEGRTKRTVRLETKKEI